MAGAIKLDKLTPEALAATAAPPVEGSRAAPLLLVIPAAGDSMFGPTAAVCVKSDAAVAPPCWSSEELRAVVGKRPELLFDSRGVAAVEPG